MIIDSSALLAILFREVESAEFEQKIAGTSKNRMSVANALEAAIVVESRGGVDAGNELDAFLESTEIEVVPVTASQLVAARRAWRRYGKGNHAAGLNFGDCFAYALAETSGEPLLFKGNDFAQTDIKSARLDGE